ncbi:MAG: hypothetical protein JSS87_10635 [Acidobacteria bacterium]|nr:hypothetical protein [Acidobacteriota bacterium]
MRRYSAAEAIGPAWEQTTELMWRHRRWQTGLKIALVALLAEMGGASFNFSMPGRYSHLPGAVHAAMVGLALLLGFVFLVLGVILFYVGSRMQFVHFSCIAFRDTTIAPLWRRYGRLTWRWMGFKILLMLAFIVPLIPVVLIFVRGLAQGKAGAATPFAAILGLMGIVLLLMVPFILLYTAARDFVLPSVALEGTTVRFGLKRFGLWLRAEPGGILGFLFLRLLLGFVLGICAYIAMLFAVMISAIPFVVAGLLVWLPLRHASTAGHIFAGIFGVLLCVVFLAWMLVLTIAVFGTLLTFYIAWGTYYLGGRYPLLGDLLEPPVVLDTFTPPPSMPSEDDSSGPDLPLNPQPAG